MNRIETEELLGKRRIHELPKLSTVKDSGLLIVEQLGTTYKAENGDFMQYIKEHPEINKYFVCEEHKGQTNGIVPLNSNTKIEPMYLIFGKSANTVYDGGEGKKLEDSFLAHNNNKDNPHEVDQIQIGLPFVENKSSDMIRSEITSKNVTDALGYTPEIEGAYENSVKYTDKRFTDLFGSDVSAHLDTLKEIENKFKDNDSAVSVIITTLSTKASQDELDTHTNNNVTHTNTVERQQFQSAYVHSLIVHARADATKTGISTTNGNILINGSEAIVYQHPLSGISPGTYTSLTIDNQGHVTGGTNPIVSIKGGGTGADNVNDALRNLGLTATATELNVLDGIAVSTIQLNHLSGITGNIQTQLNKKSEDGHTHYYAGSSLPGGVANSANKLETPREINGILFDGSKNITITDDTKVKIADYNIHIGSNVHINSDERSGWNLAKTHAESSHAPSNAERNIIVGIQKNGTDLPSDSNRKVNVIVPTKISELTNDVGFIKSNSVVTYSISKSGSSIFLKGSDGSSTFVTDSDTDTKNTAGSTNLVASKLFLIGAANQSQSPQTNSNANVYIGTDNCLYSDGIKVSQDGHHHDERYAMSGALTNAETAINNLNLLISGINTTLANKSDSGHSHTNYASTIVTTGSGNAVTAITKSGNTVTVTKGSTFLTAHPTITMGSNTTSVAAPAFGSTFTCIDTLTKDSNGHITQINTKTVTIPKPSGVTVSQTTEPTGLSAGDFWEVEY